MKINSTLGMVLATCCALTPLPSSACIECDTDTFEEEINFCRDNQEEIETKQNITPMANKIANTVALAALALASAQSVNLAVVRSFADTYEVEESIAYQVITELLLAKQVAEHDMKGINDDGCE